MDWFKRKQEGIFTTTKSAMPDGLWQKCENCGEVIFAKAIENSLATCEKCNFHFRTDAKGYINFWLDENSFEEFNQNLKSTDHLGFVDAKGSYKTKLTETIKKSGVNEAVRTGKGKISSREVIFVAMDFNFMAASMGSVVGEKISRAIDEATKLKIPLIVVCASGGARMHEGALSLMQMAKTSAKLARFSQKGGFYIAILTNPTTGGVSASFAMLGDIILAEPKALIGFAGPRVIKQTIGKDLPDGFQTSEFLLEHGFVDRIVHRKEMKNEIKTLIELLT
ncbi:acetyl-CoA carboxylase carboxyltransferase subunit beta [bacterium]|nr:acetyl-CoA carboxylase carboxyltransferase subunit beta [bacterium]